MSVLVIVRDGMSHLSDRNFTDTYISYAIDIAFVD